MNNNKESQETDKEEQDTGILTNEIKVTQEKTHRETKVEDREGQGIIIIITIEMTNLIRMINQKLRQT